MEKRIAYQGANMALKIAIMPDGQICRAVEARASKTLSIPDRRNIRVKTGSLSNSSSAEEMTSLLYEHEDEICRTFSEYAENFVLPPEKCDLYTPYVEKTKAYSWTVPSEK